MLGRFTFFDERIMNRRTLTHRNPAKNNRKLNSRWIAQARNIIFYLMARRNRTERFDNFRTAPL